MSISMEISREREKVRARASGAAEEFFKLHFLPEKSLDGDLLNVTPGCLAFAGSNQETKERANCFQCVQVEYGAFLIRAGKGKGINYLPQGQTPLAGDAVWRKGIVAGC